MRASATFQSLENRNFRLFAGGQLVSVTGTAMQQVAQSWLVVDLTGSGVALGVTMALQFLPMLLFGPWGGLLADRLDKRRVLIATQAVSGVLALALWGLVTADVVSLWMVYVLAFLLGCATALDMPTRQSFVMEMVGPDRVANAVGLNSAVFNTGRLVGPAVAGVVIASVGVGVCFLVNGLSYVATMIALHRMRPGELVRQPAAPRERGQVRAGLRYAWRTPALRSTLFLVTVVGTFGFNFVVVLPLLAQESLGGGVRLYGVLSSLMGLGALMGALVSARRARPTRRLLIGAAGSFGVSALLVAVAPNALAAAVFMVALGISMMLFLATANSTLQLASEPVLRGRVMALYGLVFLGSTPIGGPLVGWVSEYWGPRSGVALGGLASLAAAVIAAVPGLSRHRRRRLDARGADAEAREAGGVDAEAEAPLAPLPGGGLAPGPVEAT